MELTKEQEVLQQVINEAWENENFKAELMTNPVAAIEKLTGEKLNLNGRELVVRDQTDESTIYINIPAEQNLEDAELNEEQLEAVAGGRTLPYNSFKTIFFPEEGDGTTGPTIGEPKNQF